MASISELVGGDLTKFHLMKDQIANSIRVAMPGIIEQFNPSTQTATVKPCINDRIINKDGKTEWIELPLIMDVPVQISQCKEFAITLPIQPGDFCILIIQDKCIDSFIQSGTDSIQAEIRHHDLSDAIAIVGLSPSNAVIDNYDPDNLCIRHKKKSINITVSNNNINLNCQGSNIDITPSNITISSPIVDINGTIF